MAIIREGLIGGEANEEIQAPKKKRGWAKIDNTNRLVLKNVPPALMEWLKTLAGESYRTVEGQVLYTLAGCMKINQSKEKG